MQTDIVIYLIKTQRMTLTSRATQTVKHTLALLSPLYKVNTITRRTCQTVQRTTCLPQPPPSWSPCQQVVCDCDQWLSSRCFCWGSTHVLSSRHTKFAGDRNSCMKATRGRQEICYSLSFGLRWTHMLEEVRLLR